MELELKILLWISLENAICHRKDKMALSNQQASIAVSVLETVILGSWVMVGTI